MKTSIIGLTVVSMIFTDKEGIYLILLMRSLGLDKLSNTQQIFQLQIFSFFCCQNQPTNQTDHYNTWDDFVDASSCGGGEEV